MRLIFYSTDKNWRCFADHPGREGAFATDDADAVMECLGDARASRVFIDFDTCRDADSLAASIKRSYGDTHYVIFVSDSTVSLRRHQRRKGRVDGYVVGPLDDDVLENTLTDISYGDFVSDGQTQTGLASDGHDGQEMSRKIQAAFDDVLGAGEGDEKTRPPLVPSAPEVQENTEIPLLGEDGEEVALEGEGESDLEGRAVADSGGLSILLSEQEEGGGDGPDGLDIEFSVVAQPPPPTPPAPVGEEAPDKKEESGIVLEDWDADGQAADGDEDFVADGTDSGFVLEEDGGIDLVLEDDGQNEPVLEEGPEPVDLREAPADDASGDFDDEATKFAALEEGAQGAVPEDDGGIDLALEEEEPVDDASGDFDDEATKFAALEEGAQGAVPEDDGGIDLALEEEEPADDASGDFDDEATKFAALEEGAQGAVPEDDGRVDPVQEGDGGGVTEVFDSTGIVDPPQGEDSKKQGAAQEGWTELKRGAHEMHALKRELDRLGRSVLESKERERQLESKMELMVMDTRAQVENRDKKILDLKRKIDQLEFNMENMMQQERQVRGQKELLSEKVSQAIETLQGSVEVLESNLDVDGADDVPEDR